MADIFELFSILPAGKYFLKGVDYGGLLGLPIFTFYLNGVCGRLIMERRVTSHTEEEEMNQRRHLLTLARKGDQKAVSKLMELYQVKVYSGNSLKSLKIRKLPVLPSPPKTKEVLSAAKKAALKSSRSVIRASGSVSVSSKSQKSSKSALSKKGSAHKVKPVKASGGKKKIARAKLKSKIKVRPKKKQKIQARLKSKVLARPKKSQVKAKAKVKVRPKARVQSSAKAKGKAKTKRKTSSKSVSVSRTRAKVTSKAKLVVKNKRRK